MAAGVVASNSCDRAAMGNREISSANRDRLAAAEYIIVRHP